MKVTRGIRNNNPANIRRSFSKWLGLSENQRDCLFCQFKEMDYGIRAFMILCRTYRKKYGIVDADAFIRRFAPESENDTEKYIDFVVKYAPFSLNSDYNYCCFASAVFWYESRYAVSPDYIWKLMVKFKIYIV